MITTLGVVAIGLLIFAALYGAGWLFFRALRVLWAIQDMIARRRGDLPTEPKAKAERRTA